MALEYYLLTIPFGFVAVSIVYLMYLRWQLARGLKKYFDLVKMPSTDDEKIIARKCMETQILCYQREFESAVQKRNDLLALTAIVSSGEVLARIGQLREDTTARYLAKAELKRAQRIFDALYPVKTADSDKPLKRDLPYLTYRP